MNVENNNRLEIPFYVDDYPTCVVANGDIGMTYLINDSGTLYFCQCTLNAAGWDTLVYAPRRICIPFLETAAIDATFN